MHSSISVSHIVPLIPGGHRQWKESTGILASVVLSEQTPLMQGLAKHSSVSVSQSKPS